MPTLSGEIREEDFAEGLDLVVKSFDALDLGGVFRTFFGVDVVLAAFEPDLMKRQNGDNFLFFNGWGLIFLQLWRWLTPMNGGNDYDGDGGGGGNDADA